MSAPNSSPGLLWFAECLEEASWPTDREGEVQRAPTSLANNRYTHHADAFCCAMEGHLGVPVLSIPLMDSGRRPVLAGIRDRMF